MSSKYQTSDSMVENGVNNDQQEEDGDIAKWMQNLWQIC